MEQMIVPSDSTTIGALAGIAAYITKPLDFVHDDHLALPPLDGPALKRLNADASFRAPLNRAAALTLGLSSLAFSPDLAVRARTESDLKIALGLLGSDRAGLLDLARSCAAVQLFPQIRSCVLKSQRRAMEAILGEAAFTAAVRESAVFYPLLAERSRSFELTGQLDSDDPQARAAIDGAETPRPREDAIHPIVWEGLATVLAFVRRVEGGCATLLSLRFPKPALGGSSALAPLTDQHAAEFRLLLKRRGMKW